MKDGRHGLRRSTLAGLMCCAIAVGGCKTFTGNLSAVDEKPFDGKNPNVDQDAVIEISVPQIYSRDLEARADLRDLQRDIDRTRLEIELQQLRDQLEKLRK